MLKKWKKNPPPPKTEKKELLLTMLSPSIGYMGSMGVYSSLNWLNGWCFPSSFFFGAVLNNFHWPITKKKLELLKLTIIEDFIYIVPPIWPNYVSEKGKILGKTYGMKMWCYWKHLEEHIGNLMGTTNPCPPKRKTPQLTEQNFCFKICLWPFST